MFVRIAGLADSLEPEKEAVAAMVSPSADWEGVWSKVCEPRAL